MYVDMLVVHHKCHRVRKPPSYGLSRPRRVGKAGLWMSSGLRQVN